MKAHFFDIDTILIIDNKVWIVDKKRPNIPIMKVSQSDFNLIKSGIYKSQNSKIEFSGKSYYLPKEMMDVLKIKCKNYKSDISNLGFSMQEFMNKELIENIEYKINTDNIQHVKNTDDHIYIICSKNNKKNYELMIKKMEDKFKSEGLVVKNYYFISETFYNRNEDKISHDKVRLLLQHLIGLKTDGNKFTNNEILKYDEIYYYDDDPSSTNLAINSNSILQVLISNSESSIKLKVKETLKNNDNILYVNLVSPNKINRFKTSKINIEWSNLIKAFENFNWKG
jgi:hypothetical protein